ncbi:hypothetical protein L1049_022925 [Liquidambar formosana]|uniref:Uncharacterized protein n=1 Tax=Liquidambar formosana TaxID=63359 RepID=A0AAP0RDC4_LIQFO
MIKGVLMEISYMEFHDNIEHCNVSTYETMWYKILKLFDRHFLNTPFNTFFSPFALDFLEGKKKDYKDLSRILAMVYDRITDGLVVPVEIIYFQKFISLPYAEYISSYAKPSKFCFNTISLIFIFLFIYYFYSKLRNSRMILELPCVPGIFKEVPIL